MLIERVLIAAQKELTEDQRRAILLRFQGEFRLKESGDL
jgi:hypothetical protein